MKKMQLYQSVALQGPGKALYCILEQTTRPPHTVPYLIDNLWEWQRPEECPCRRFSATASPTPELAVQSGPPGGRAYQLEFLVHPKIAQLKGYAHSAQHPECTSLRTALFTMFNETTGSNWLELDPQTKGQVGQLWLPCLRKQEIDFLFAHNPLLQTIEEQLASLVTYWQDVEVLDLHEDILPDATGEIFFESEEGYRLLPL